MALAEHLRILELICLDSKKLLTSFLCIHDGIFVAALSVISQKPYVTAGESALFTASQTRRTPQLQLIAIDRATLELEFTSKKYARRFGGAIHVETKCESLSAFR